ncbi:MAG: polyhydroxyalkanoate synthesis regulator phasin [Flavobacteriales bacterium]|jgi:polyhydroxyalkanoate synthesis regulator phasin
MTNKKSSPFSAAEIAQMANTKPQGKRPEYFSSAMSEHGFSISVALMAELAVARERIDSLERILVAKGVLAQDEIEKFVPTEEQSEARQIAQVEYSARILRSLQQEVELMAEKQPLSMDEMADKLGEADISENTD